MSDTVDDLAGLAVLAEDVNQLGVPALRALMEGLAAGKTGVLTPKTGAAVWHRACDWLQREGPTAEGYTERALLAAIIYGVYGSQVAPALDAVRPHLADPHDRLALEVLDLRLSMSADVARARSVFRWAAVEDLRRRQLRPGTAARRRGR